MNAVQANQFRSFESVWRLGGVPAVRRWVYTLTCLNLPKKCSQCPKMAPKDFAVYELTDSGIVICCNKCVTEQASPESHIGHRYLEVCMLYSQGPLYDG